MKQVNVFIANAPIHGPLEMRGREAVLAARTARTPTLMICLYFSGPHQWHLYLPFYAPLWELLGQDPPPRADPSACAKAPRDSVHLPWADSARGAGAGAGAGEEYVMARMLRHYPDLYRSRLDPSVPNLLCVFLI